MIKDMSSFIEEELDEKLYKKKCSMRGGFDAKGNRPLCMLPHRLFSQFINRMFNMSGYDNYHKNPKPSIEYMGFIIISADVDDLMFCIEI